MPVTMKDVVNILDRDEPDYEALEAFGADALPHLELLAQSRDPLRAAKAAYAGTLINGAAATNLIQQSVKHSDPQVRIAVAHALGRIGARAPVNLVLQLLDDTDVGVRKIALRTAASVGKIELREKVRSIAASDPHEFMRVNAQGVATKMR